MFPCSPLIVLVIKCDVRVSRDQKEMKVWDRKIIGSINYVWRGTFSESTTDGTAKESRQKKITSVMINTPFIGCETLIIWLSGFQVNLPLLCNHNEVWQKIMHVSVLQGSRSFSSHLHRVISISKNRSTVSLFVRRSNIIYFLHWAKAQRNPEQRRASGR